MANGTIDGGICRMPDYTNLIHSQQPTAISDTYTALQKCWAFIRLYVSSASDRDFEIRVNNNSVCSGHVSKQYEGIWVFLPLSRGDTISFISSNSNDSYAMYRVYGVK